jgi:hypothetical protein
LTYIKKHWNGECSLAVSFWINVILINIFIRIFEIWLSDFSTIENPVTASQVSLIFFIMGLTIVYPWQIVGLWRSASRYSIKKSKSFWSGTVKVVIVLGFLGTLGNLTNSWKAYEGIYQIGFGKDEYSDYRINLVNDNTFIQLEGGLGFGISEEVNKVLSNNLNIKGIILDSIGGRIYEGRELSKIILINNLDTYTIKGCYSACVTAFISGNKRYLAKGANIGLHQYKMVEGLEPYFDMSSEQEKDLKIYKRQGISQWFIDKMFKVKHDDLWYPTIDEMLDASVIHQVINPSSLKSIKYEHFDKDEIEKALKGIPAFEAIKKYEPRTYKQILQTMEIQMKNGASIIEMQQDVAKYIKLILGKVLPITSDEALVRFAHATINILRTLENKSPILCMKYLFPEKYGSFDITKYLSKKEMEPMLDALNLIIIDSNNKNNPVLDILNAERLMEKAIFKLGDEVVYLEGLDLKNEDDYSKTCNAIINLYGFILLNNNEVTGNGLRYIFTD